MFFKLVITCNMASYRTILSVELRGRVTVSNSVLRRSLPYLDTTALPDVLPREADIEATN